jgi:hypothetical protein
MVTHRKTKISAAAAERSESLPESEPDQSSSADPVSSFIELCALENITMPLSLATLSQKKAFLRNASIALEGTHFAGAQVREHVASLLWLQAHHDSPDDMSILPHALWCQIWALFNIPPHFHPAANNFVRLLEWSKCNSPIASSAVGQHDGRLANDDERGASADTELRHLSRPRSTGFAAEELRPQFAAERSRSRTQARGGFLLDTRRPLDDDEFEDHTDFREPHLDLVSQGSMASHHSSHHRHHTSQSHHSSRHFVSFRQQYSEELKLYPDVYQATDLTRLLKEAARITKVAACAKKESEISRDNENSPEFACLTRFHLVPEAPVDLLQRGILLAQSSVLPPLIPDSALTKANVEVITGKLLTAFENSKTSWGADREIGWSIISKLRDFILERYRHRLEIVNRDYAHCPILLSHCTQQSQELSSSGSGKNYFDQLDLHITHISQTPAGVLNFTVFNRAHLQLLYPSIRSFIQLLPHASSRIIADEIDDICNSGVASSSPTVAPPAKRARINPTVVITTPRALASPIRTSWVGLPFDKDVVGSDLGLDPPPRNPCRICGAPHYSVNCPQQYFITCKERCPGFNNKGERIPSAWSGTILTPATRREWDAYNLRHGLIRSKYASSEVKF